MIDLCWFNAQLVVQRPRALAALTRLFRDVDLAEEAFSIACERAMKSWQKSGNPDDPFAWLLTVSRNAARDIIRKRKREETHHTALGFEQPESPENEYIQVIDEGTFRDDVLRLLFICCHPSLKTQDQMAVALRVVVGLSIEDIARSMFIKSKTMEQRITRAKKTISQANTTFDTPTLSERNKRLKAVMLMLYLLFNEGWTANTSSIQTRPLLCEEAIRLTRMLMEMFPEICELTGMLALFLLQHSRYSARTDDNGQLVMLEFQDRIMWDRHLIAEGLVLVEKALRHGMPGTYQTQAAIAAVHAESLIWEKTDWQEIERLYQVLEMLDPSPVVRLNHASAVARTKGPKAALTMLDSIEDELTGYKYFHAARAKFFQDLKEFENALTAYHAVLKLDPGPQEIEYIQQQIAVCQKELPTLSG